MREQRATKIFELLRCRPHNPDSAPSSVHGRQEYESPLNENIKNTSLKSLQAAVGIKLILKCWMEMSYNEARR